MVVVCDRHRARRAPRRGSSAAGRNRGPKPRPVRPPAFYHCRGCGSSSTMSRGDAARAAAGALGRDAHPFRQAAIPTARRCRLRLRTATSMPAQAPCRAATGRGRAGCSIDIGSSNGTYVEGRRVTETPVAPASPIGTWSSDRADPAHPVVRSETATLGRSRRWRPPSSRSRDLRGSFRRSRSASRSCGSPSQLPVKSLEMAAKLTWRRTRDSAENSALG